MFPIVKLALYALDKLAKDQGQRTLGRCPLLSIKLSLLIIGRAGYSLVASVKSVTSPSRAEPFVAVALFAFYVVEATLA